MSHEPTLEEEQATFESQLDDLLREHKGQFALVRGGVVIGFFPDEASAYEAAIKQFGPEAVFLIAAVEKTDPKPISVAWDFGVMFVSDQA